MDCEAVRIELSSFSRGELGSEQRSEVQRHLGSCSGCRSEFSELQSLLALVSASGVSPPSQELRTSVLGAVEEANLSSLLNLAVKAPPTWIKEEVMAAARGESPEAAPTSVPFLVRRRRQLASALAAAAILLAGFMLGSAMTAGDGGEETDLAVPSGHETQILELEGMGPAEASVRHYRHDNFRVTLSVEGFESTPSGFHYAVWVRGSAGDVGIGTFRLKRADDFEIPFAVGVNPSDYSTFAVTLEPNDGDPALTGKVVSEGRFDPVRVHHGSYDD